MKMHIVQWSAWINGIDSVEGLTDWAVEPTDTPADFNLPVPDYVPKINRRRLSPLAKIVLSQVACLDNFHLYPSVFCTRHGDLPKTVELIADVVRGESLSPTQFALSVHNAVSGQFGIFAHNVQASTLISAGRDSFHLGLIDAITRLEQSEAEHMLYVYADMPLPEPYQGFADEMQFAHCIALKLAKDTSAAGDSMTMHQKQLAQTAITGMALPHSLQFLRQFVSRQRSFEIEGNSHWDWSRD
ncbi:beta-ketoacyl synthase chain length factor [Neptunicella sp. SCSIO 80796]|uniref:beta-ketoacyl synthase chain length factor n=1 Tax=Neptunicella plasticusilytica TaxID=3117012 RepID=UPI003A4DEED6